MVPKLPSDQSSAAVDYFYYRGGASAGNQTRATSMATSTCSITTVRVRENGRVMASGLRSDAGTFAETD